MLLLALDTSTASTTVALHGGSGVLGEVASVDPLAHGEHLVPNLDRLLAAVGVAAGDLDAVAVGVGPGPYTGLRVGVVTALVLGHLRDLPVHGVCSLDALALQAVREGPAAEQVVVASDARRKEVYWARYDVAALPARVDGPHVDRPAALADLLDGEPVVGEGGRMYADVLPGYAGLDHVRAAYLAEYAAAALAAGLPLLPPEPLYLRRPDATVPGPAKPVPLATGRRSREVPR